MMSVAYLQVNATDEQHTECIIILPVPFGMGFLLWRKRVVIR